MELQYLQNFILLAGNKSFSKTAEQVYISQPALTKQIKSLEKELGVTLFIRTSRRLELTEEGKILLRHAQAINSSYQLLQRELSLKQSRALRIGYITDAHRPYIEKILEYADEKYAHLEVSVVKNMPQQIIEMICHDQLDCAVMHLPSVKGEKDLMYQTVIPGGVVARMSLKNPLSRRSSVSLEDLENMQILISANACPKCNQYVKDAYRKAGVEPRWKTVNSIESVEMLSRTVDSISFTSCYNRKVDGMATVPVEELHDGFDIVFVYRKDRDQKFMDQLYHWMKMD